jgi:ethanolamine utilization protein EutA
MDVGARVAPPPGSTVATDPGAFAAYLADRLFDVIRRAPRSGRSLLRTPDLAWDGRCDAVAFSGGVAEYIYGRETRTFGDIGPLLAAEVRERAERLGLRVLRPVAGIRATVIGASQHTVQLSGNTIYLSSRDVVPLRNVPVARPALPLDDDEVRADHVTAAIRSAIDRLELRPSSRSVALAFEWRGAATYDRLGALARGVAAAQGPQIRSGKPIVLVNDGDIGGLVGLRLREELGPSGRIVSIDGVELREFDHIDVGALIEHSGSVPVVIKSLVFAPPDASDTRTPASSSAHRSTAARPRTRA